MNSELNSLIEQWKNSSPYAQERLQLLKKIINLNGENKLYNEEEQIKFNIKKENRKRTVIVNIDENGDYTVTEEKSNW